ncbi:hypothetical protein CJA_3506 [Cellvibrio japonicus Ueda107]|uniref:Uncharacterized protein n=1 Tax=Cellvibrio japonicus (strain Ueda107) TaxID=498211 RepID=B3PG52_CELJU|nr:hypothetical protein CJA_3506 [Cellvibrio japonicus Ueda107]
MAPGGSGLENFPAEASRYLWEELPLDTLRA